MKSPKDRRTWRDKRQGGLPSRSVKKPYTPPRVERLGTLTEMTQGVGGGWYDGGLTSAY